MNYRLQSSDAFRAELTESSPAPDLTLLHLTADAADAPAPLELTLVWTCPDIGVLSAWTPGGYKDKTLIPNWCGLSRSFATSGAPIYTMIGADDGNRLTIACSDAKNQVGMHAGIIEENGCLDCRVVIHVDSAIAHYEADIRIDRRALPFYRVVGDVSDWWTTYEGYTPAAVPEAAREPLYSAWYSYHQAIDVPAIVDECRYFAQRGVRVLIVDDGWQTEDGSRGYDYCGDWQPTPAKIPSMKVFVEAVHAAGMKFVLWYSVPFVGEYTAAYERFRNQMLDRDNRADFSKTHTLDPRFPAVREHLIQLYRQAVLDWDLDGLKLDFIDSFYQTDRVSSDMDFVSVYDAVDRLMKDILAALRAIKPDILIEFRQSYIGPLMRTFGNMFRAGDCPCDARSNRLATLTLRMLCGRTAIHSDMVMWHPDEPAELAAFQLTGVLFAVPQISVRRTQMTPEQAEMVDAYLAFWRKYRTVLLDGELFYKGYAADFPYVSARKGDVQVGAVYAGMIAYIPEPTDTIALVNASAENRILIDAPAAGRYHYVIADCRGRQTGSGELALNGAFPVIDSVPVNGTVTLTRI